MTPIEIFLHTLTEHGCDPKQSSKGWSARCPAHEDRNPSLSVAQGDDGRVLVKCHANCEVGAVCAAVGMRVSELMPAVVTLTKPAKPSRNGKPRIVANYDYRDEAGQLLFQAVRYDPKDFRQRRPKAGGGWDWSVKGVRVIPYRLPDLRSIPSQPVAIVEGEKDVDNLANIGVLATCNAGGAGKWKTEHSAFLQGRQIFILPDNDEAGRKHAQQVAESLFGIAKSVRVVKLPGIPEKGDASDWIAAGGTKAELDRLAGAAPVGTSEAAESWPEIDSFDVLDLPKFPTQVLPDVLRQWVEAESHATQTPADLAGLLALSVCSVGIARHVVIEPRPGWREPANLFTAVLLEPGNRKSAVFADALKPLREVEAEMIETARPMVAHQQSEWRQDERKLQKLEKWAVDKEDAVARHEAGELAELMSKQAEPVLPRLIVDDATSEKLGMMLADHGGRIASMSPEGGVFDMMAGLYSKSGIPQFGVYLMGHSGDDMLTDRVSRKSVRVERPALTCAYAMQPQVIEGLADNTAFRGRGLLARFLYAAPQSWIGQREIAPTPVPQDTQEGYRQTVRRLVEDSENTENESGELVLRLTSKASATFQSWEAEVERKLAEGGQMEIMRDWGAKLAGATLRLAAVLHSVEHGRENHIEAGTIAAAVEIARYLIPHAEAVLNMMAASEETGEDDARYVLRWIERHCKREFTKRNAQQHGKRRFPKADGIDPALAELIRRGYIRQRLTETSGPGRPPSPTYEVNPAVFEKAEDQKRSQYSHNSVDELETSNSENNENALAIPTAQSAYDWGVV